MNPSRREFLRNAVASAGALGSLSLLGRAGRLTAIEPIERRGPARFRTSLVAYSFRERLKPKGHKPTMTLFDLIDFAADQGFQGVELTSYYFEEPTTDAYLDQLKRHAYLRGLSVSGTAVGNHFALRDRSQLPEQIALVKTGIDRGALLGAPYVRVFAGNVRAMDYPGAFQMCVDAFQECAEYAGSKGMFIGLENDSGLMPDTILALTKAVKSPWFALNLDFGNFHTPDVYADLERCAPYAVNVHYKWDIQETGKPAVRPDIPRLLGILRRVRYQGFLAFEYEHAGDPYQVVPGWKRELDSALAS